MNCFSRVWWDKEKVPPPKTSRSQSWGLVLINEAAVLIVQEQDLLLPVPKLIDKALVTSAVCI